MDEKLMIVLDDAARMVDSKSHSDGIVNLIRVIRSVGIVLDFNVQSADVTHEILSNSANKFIGPCGSASDYDRIAAAVGMDREQRAWLNANLKPGTFVAHLGESTFRKPFVLQMPQIHFDESARESEAERIENLRELMTLPTLEAEEFRDWPSTRSNSVTTQGNTRWENSESGLSEAELRFINAVIENPGTASSHLAKLARVSTRNGVEIRGRLVEQGYLREHSINTGKRGRASVVLEPLQPAFEAVGGGEGGES